METKFLSDGRKVVVVGALNNQETIVQEVFVTQQGDEIPGGERFVVKSHMTSQLNHGCLVKKQNKKKPLLMRS